MAEFAGKSLYILDIKKNQPKLWLFQHMIQQTEWSECVRSIGMGYRFVYIGFGISYLQLHQSFLLWPGYTNIGCFINFSHHFRVVMNIRNNIEEKLISRIHRTHSSIQDNNKNIGWGILAELRVLCE